MLSSRGGEDGKNRNFLHWGALKSLNRTRLQTRPSGTDQCFANQRIREEPDSLERPVTMDFGEN